MRDDAVLRRALPLGRGLGRNNEAQITQKVIQYKTNALNLQIRATAYF